MKRSLSIFALGLGCILTTSCGGSANPPPKSGTEPHPGATTDSGAPGTAPTQAPDASNPDGSATDQPKPPIAVMVPENSVEETFPSGLVVDQRVLGGPAPGPVLPKDSRILHIGDSFAGALGIELNKVLNAAGTKGKLEFETSTYIPTWAYSKKLPGVLQAFNPDLVLISLGANELENPEPEKRAPLIKKLVASLGGRACVWIAPVLWDGAKKELLDVIAANSAPCVYLDSNKLVKKMPRAGDKIHPSMAARPDWALVTARWLAYHRKQPGSRPWELSPTP